MKRVLYLTIVCLGFKCIASAQFVPSILWGKWIVQRELPTRTIACWGDREAEALIGTELEYSSGVFRWRQTVTNNPVTETTTVTSLRFQDENSGRGTNSSQVTFDQLGIKERQAVRIVIRHPPASITGATIEIPGDRVLVKDQDTIVFSVCNIYFEARRSAAPGRN